VFGCEDFGDLPRPSQVITHTPVVSTVEHANASNSIRSSFLSMGARCMTGVEEEVSDVRFLLFSILFQRCVIVVVVVVVVVSFFVLRKALTARKSHHHVNEEKEDPGVSNHS